MSLKVTLDRKLTAMVHLGSRGHENITELGQRYHQDREILLPTAIGVKIPRLHIQKTWELQSRNEPLGCLARGIQLPSSH